MRFFGITVGDWVGIATLLTLAFGAMSSLFKRLVVDNLTRSLDSLTAQLRESQKDRERIHKSVDELEDKVIIIEKDQQDQKDRYKEHLRHYHKVEGD